MTKLELKMPYKAFFVDSGVGKTNRPYEILKYRAPGQRQATITISVNNAPAGVDHTGIFQIDRITRIEIWNTKDAKGNWYQNHNIRISADVTAIHDMVPARTKEHPNQKKAEKAPKFKELRKWWDD